jgi:hypothetical protein
LLAIEFYIPHPFLPPIETAVFLAFTVGILCVPFRDQVPDHRHPDKLEAATIFAYNSSSMRKTLAIHKLQEFA